ncbi:hypothetical protein [uncultured Aquitalea sp.]|uniref:hypothetical protein n=1 Tax=uncultured Aquitalea sp. TaxID=540272 RepID=UPI0025F789C6|nr:hypothetical protein [uncultured Aquitalea sp.]
MSFTQAPDKIRGFSFTNKDLPELSDNIRTGQTSLREDAKMTQAAFFATQQLGYTSRLLFKQLLQHGP